MRLVVVLSMFMSWHVYAVLPINKPAPDFSLQGNDGKLYKLSELKGKFVVLEWFNNECPYVDKHYHETFRNMQNLQEKWTQTKSAAGQSPAVKEPVVWLAVVSSAPGKQGHVDAKAATQIKSEVRKAHMNAILLDPNGKVGKAYEALTTPHMFIIDPKGIVRYNGAIDDKPSAQVASIKGAKNYVTDALASLTMGKNVAVAATKPYGCSVKY